MARRARSSGCRRNAPSTSPSWARPKRVCIAAREAAKGAKADINVVATAHRRKQLLIADMDSTIISAECLDELADMAGLKPEIAAITERAMKGEIAFEPALRERVSHLKGLRLDALERVMRERIRLTGGAKELVATMRANGATHAARLRRLHLLHAPRRATGRLRRAAGQCAARRRRAADRHWSRSRSWAATPSSTALEDAVAARGLDMRATAGAWATAPTIWP